MGTVTTLWRGIESNSYGCKATWRSAHDKQASSSLRGPVGLSKPWDRFYVGRLLVRYRRTRVIL